MKITISSLPGAGSSTAARLLASAFHIPRIDAGDLWDEIAAERNLDVLGLNRAAEKDRSIDIALDEKMLEYARSSGDLLLEARLIGWLCKRHGIPAFKVWVACPLLVRAERVATRERAETKQIVRETEEREASEAKRFQMYYGIDIYDLSAYDLIVDSEKLEPTGIVERIRERLPH